MGMTDPDTIAKIGGQLGAKYVVAGNIGKLGDQNLLIISILKIDDLRQIAGDIQIYKDIEEIQDKLPEMAQNIIEAVELDAAGLDKLAVTPVQLGENVDEQLADTLAQVLSIHRRWRNLNAGKQRYLTGTEYEYGFARASEQRGNARDRKRLEVERQYLQILRIHPRLWWRGVCERRDIYDDRRRD
jgi:hypothetical protein